MNEVKKRYQFLPYCEIPYPSQASARSFAKLLRQNPHVATSGLDIHPEPSLECEKPAFFLTANELTLSSMPSVTGSWSLSG